MPMVCGMSLGMPTKLVCGWYVVCGYIASGQYAIGQGQDNSPVKIAIGN